ncbi:MAG: IS1 family transposase [Deltaproteobacteria bacterium]|nr:IS1 family transposase [Deltaproteobacteria bacterium]
METATRLRVGRGIGQNETEAAVELWEHIKQRDAHQDCPPPVLSDGWGGHREALLEVYGQVPAYTGRGRPPTRKQPSDEWHYTQMVKQHDTQGHFLGVNIRVIYGDETTLDLTGEHTAYIERTNLTSRHMNARLTRKTLGFSKHLEMLRASSMWEDMVYNLTRPVKTLRREVNDGQRRWLPQSPAMKAGLTDHVWSIRELLTRLPVPTNSI